MKQILTYPELITELRKSPDQREGLVSVGNGRWILLNLPEESELHFVDIKVERKFKKHEWFIGYNKDIWLGKRPIDHRFLSIPLISGKDINLIKTGKSGDYIVTGTSDYDTGDNGDVLIRQLYFLNDDHTLSQLECYAAQINAGEKAQRKKIQDINLQESTIQASTNVSAEILTLPKESAKNFYNSRKTLYSDTTILLKFWEGLLETSGNKATILLQIVNSIIALSENNIEHAIFLLFLMALHLEKAEKLPLVICSLEHEEYKYFYNKIDLEKLNLSEEKAIITLITKLPKVLKLHKAHKRQFNTICLISISSSILFIGLLILATQKTTLISAVLFPEFFLIIILVCSLVKLAENYGAMKNSKESIYSGENFTSECDSIDKKMLVNKIQNYTFEEIKNKFTFCKTNPITLFQKQSQEKNEGSELDIKNKF